MKKVCIFIMFISLLVVGCNKDVKGVEESREYIEKEVEMFMNITEESDYLDVVRMMKDAEEKGLGKYFEASEDSYGGEFGFSFNIVDKEAEEFYTIEEKIENRNMVLNGHPTFNSSYEGTRIYVGYEKDKYGINQKITEVSYYSETNREELNSLSYSFKKNKIESISGIGYSKELGRLEEKADKKEVDEFLKKCLK